MGWEGKNSHATNLSAAVCLHKNYTIPFKTMVCEGRGMM